MNASDCRKLPIAIIGKVVRPLCFRPPAPGFPAPCFIQGNSWMDGPTMAHWFASVFVQVVRRVTTAPVSMLQE